MTLIVALLAVAVALLTVIVFGLLRTHADILRALDRAGVRLDDDAPAATIGPVPVAPPHSLGPVADVVGTVPGGGPVKIAVAGVGHTTLLAFLSSGCRTCQNFWATFADPALVLPGTDTRLVIVGQDAAHDSESKLADLAPGGVRTVCSTAAWQHYDVPGSPYFVLLDGPSATVIGSGSATSWEQVSGLLSRAIGDAALSGVVKAGTAGPRSTDEALQAAGIGPGHPSLWPDTVERPS